MDECQDDQIEGGAAPRPLTPGEVGSFVRNSREAKGWTQEVLATLAALNVRTIQRVEDGQAVSDLTRRTLARVLELPDTEFLNRPISPSGEAEVRRLLAECERLGEEKRSAEERLAKVSSDMREAQVALGMAAARDAAWLHAVRTTLMPKQPSRVPFHNALEIAQRGYHCCIRGRPMLTTVTWSPLPYNEGGLHRGFNAGLIMRGADFAPGVTWVCRRKAAAEGSPDAVLHWKQPNIYFGDHLETSTTTDPDETPVSYRGMEFAVRNPGGEVSDWVEFSFPFDDERLIGIMQHSEDEGRRLLAAGDPVAAVEPLRKAWVFSRALHSEGTGDHARIEDAWKAARDGAAWARLRFKVGDRLRVVQGKHVGNTGVVREVHPGCWQAYAIVPDAGGAELFAADDELQGEAA